MTEFEIRAELKRRKITQKHIAAELDVTQHMVSYVIAGQNWEGPKGRQIMEHIAGLLGVPVEVAFPHSERRKRPFPTEAAA
jgi:transcriptional regulator with XRE-family HTH domain